MTGWLLGALGVIAVGVGVVVLACCMAAAEADRFAPRPPRDAGLRPPVKPGPLSRFGGADVVAAAEQILKEEP